ncbi:hypothetical protein CGRA01v4_05584 [Colletotrichum graminicola]|nr:hypothetical protein CGRA01v4_05584 [Colletotrichum graminicola]
MLSVSVRTSNCSGELVVISCIFVRGFFASGRNAGARSWTNRDSEISVWASGVALKLCWWTLPRVRGRFLCRRAEKTEWPPMRFLA